MAHTIAALFDDLGRAEGALQALMTAGLSGPGTVLIRGEPRGSELAPFRDASASGAAAQFRAHGAAIPADYRALFEDGVRRGGCVLLTEASGQPDEAIRIIETFEPTDLDRGSEDRQRRNAGEAQGGVDIGATLGAGLTAGMGQGNTNLESVPGTGQMADDTSTLGTADLRTSEMSLGDQGRSTIPVGDRRSEERAGAPGVRELAGSGRVRAYRS
jgi:hypothetical protein